MTPVSPVGGEVDVARLREDERATLMEIVRSCTNPGVVRVEVLGRLVVAVEHILTVRLKAAESARDEALAVVERVSALGIDVNWQGKSQEYQYGFCDGAQRQMEAVLAALTPSAPTEESQA